MVGKVVCVCVCAGVCMCVCRYVYCVCMYCVLCVCTCVCVYTIGRYYLSLILLPHTTRVPTVTHDIYTYSSGQVMV